MADVDLRVSEEAGQKLFESVRDQFHFAKSGSSGGAVAVGYAVEATLAGGELDFQANNTVKLSELDILFPKLDLTFSVDIPQICFGGFCALKLFKKCIIWVPQVCFFSASPDVTVTLPLGGLVRSEVSGACAIKTRYFVNPARGALDPWTANLADKSHEWRFHLDLAWLNLDVFDVADMVGDLVDNMIDSIVSSVFGWFPGWAQSAINAILGGISNFIRVLLDIPSDVVNWLSNLLGTSLGLLNLILQVVIDYFAQLRPLIAIDDPFPIMPATAAPPPGIPSPILVPVLIPILAPVALVDATDLHVSFGVGSL